MNILKRLDEIGVSKRIRDLNEIMKDKDPVIRKTIQKSIILDVLFIDEKLDETVKFKAMDSYLEKLVDDIVGFQSSETEVKEFEVHDEMTLIELMDTLFGKKKGERNE